MDMFKKTTFVRFCFASASMLPEELGLSTEQLICLYKECIEMAKHCYDIGTMIKSCMQYVVHSNSLGRHADSLRCLKEILPLAVTIPCYELMVHQFLSITYRELNEFENVVLHAKKWIEIAQTIGDKENEMYGHHEMGNAFSFLARYDDAIDCGKKCLKIAQEIDSAEGMMIAYDCIGVAYKYMEKYDDTILYAHKLLDCALKNNDQEAMMNAYLMLGDGFSSLARYDDAIDCGKKFLTIAQEIDSADDEMKAYNLIMDAYENMEKYDDTILYAHKLLDCAMKNNNQEAMMYAYLMLGDGFSSLARYDDAIDCGKKFLKIAQEIDSADGEMNAYKCIIVAYKYMEKYDDTILYAHKLLDCAMKNNNQEAMMNAYLRLGNAFFSLARYDDAIDCGKKCLTIAQEIDSADGMMMAYDCIRVAYENMQKYDDTILYAHKFLDCAMKNKNQEIMMKVYLELGRAHRALNHYQEAIDFGQKCIEIAREIEDRRIEVRAYLLMGQIYNALSDFDNAIIYGNKCIELAITIGDKDVAAHAYSLLGKIYYSLEKYDDAISNCNNCLHIDKEDIEEKSAHVTAYLTLGKVYQSLEKYDEAIQNYQQCIDIVNRFGIEKREEAGIYSLLGDIYYSLEKYDDAISNCNKCLHIDKEDNEETTADINAYLTLGKAYRSLEKYDEAIQNYQQCIDIVNRTGLVKRADIAAYLGIVEIYVILKHYNDAARYFKKCIDVAQKTGEKEIEARACLVLSSVYHASGDKESIDNVIQYGKKCLDISQEIGDKKTEMEGHVILAQVYNHSLQSNEASQSIDAGMAIATELGDKEAEEKLKEIRSTLYTRVGLREKVDAPSVKELLEVPTCSEDELLQDLDQAVKTGDKSEKHRVLLRLYNLYHVKRDYEKAINCLEQMKEMDIGRSFNLFCCAQIGNQYHSMGQNEMALRSFEEGLSFAESCPDNDRHLSQFYHCFGQLLYELKIGLDLAEHCLREAIRCFEAIFTTLGTHDEFKISIFDEYFHSYKLLAILLIKGDQMKEGLLVLDRCRARALKDLMMSHFKMKQEESNDEHLEYSDVLSLVSRNDFSIAFYSLCFDGFLKFFVGGETNLHYSLCSNHSLQIDVVTLFNEMGVREVVNCENRSLDKEEDIQKEQRRSQEEYEELNQATALLLNLDSNRGESNENSAETKGSTLEDLFDISECDKILSSKQEEVVIIPDGPLYQVPFPALQDPRTGKYLSETKRIRLAPSLATLKHFEDFPTDQTSDAKPLIIGNPLVGKVMMDGEEQDIDGLLGAQAEAIVIAYKLGVKPLIGEAATKQAVLEKLQKGVSVVHIAAHGILSKATIVLAPSPDARATKIPDEEDYMLTMADVQKAQVRAQLVVLSCCHSGRGEIRAEGVVSMCRAFLASGARAVVASLWAIDDHASLDFMTSFYGNLKNGKSASTSLQLTMNEMRNTSKYTDPKYWAPFFIMGDDITLKSVFVK
ncbi:tetratricopeptide repeat protein 28-like [Actinia tenebrosa]|uniref:Tetratricopeptide repeat protein 28-like n=1 Tax=Actinia tenebrosa TaxID=6105 RepID=A0A6P8HJE9_ACTTE|nr:tetratricopeptide repeat protein 28-like [Actinia tenebrosa]